MDYASAVEALNLQERGDKLYTRAGQEVTVRTAVERSRLEAKAVNLSRQIGHEGRVRLHMNAYKAWKTIYASLTWENYPK